MLVKGPGQKCHYCCTQKRGIENKANLDYILLRYTNKKYAGNVLWKNNVKYLVDDFVVHGYF